jgi:hypothetical protein
MERFHNFAEVEQKFSLISGDVLNPSAILASGMLHQPGEWSMA